MADELSPRFVRLAKRLLPNSPIICDIGSRDALEGISLFKQLGARTLHIFEPNPSAAEICRRNLAPLWSEKASNCLFNEVAVTDVVSQVKFYPVNPTLSQNKDIGFSSLLPINPDYTQRRGHVVQDEIIVNATTLDAYFADKPYPDILWIDVEGAELRVLRGAANVLPHVKLIHVEVSFRPMQIGKPLFWEIQRCLTGWDFVFYGFMEVSALKGFLYRHRLLPNLPWRLNAVFYRKVA